MTHLTKNIPRFALFCLFAVALIASSVQTAYSQTIEGCNATMTTRIDQYYQGPIFVDAYWTESSSALSADSDTLTQREVGPGDGKATLAVVLMNRSPIDISAANGFLELPEGYEPTGTSIVTEPNPIRGGNGKRLGFSSPAVATFDSIIPAKTSFTLYYDVNILDTAEVGTKTAEMVVLYYRVSDPGLCTSALLKFPLVLPGKTILDVATDGNYLTPKVPNTVNITILNKGSADATGVVAAIVGLGDSGTRSQNNDDGSVVLDSSDTELINLGDKVFNIGTIPAHGAVSVSTVIFPGTEAAGTVQNMNVQLAYGNGYGDMQNYIVGTGLVILPNPMDASVGITYDSAESSHILVAEKLEDLNFVVTNNSPSIMSNVVVSLVPQSTSVTIVGDSKWTIPTLEPDETRKISTKVISAKSLIATPTAFTVNLNYVLGDEEKTDTMNLGAFITGDVNINVYDLSVNYVANAPNLVGNILNQGNTAALYTNVQLLSANGAENSQIVEAVPSDARPAAPSQYVGDISADSSIPFSIPLGQSEILKPGLNHVTLKITYADNLKNFHEIIWDGQVNFEKRPNPDDVDKAKRSSASNDQIIIIGVILAAVAGAIVFLKKRSSKNKMTTSNGQFENEIDSLLKAHEKEQNKK